jgi:hypothetical protein
MKPLNYSKTCKWETPRPNKLGTVQHGAFSRIWSPKFIGWESRMSDIRCLVGERLRIGDQVVIKIVAVEGEFVHIRISAPDTIVICRERSLQDQNDVEDFFHSE